jgi:hypothetical protein
MSCGLHHNIGLVNIGECVINEPKIGLELLYMGTKASLLLNSRSSNIIVNNISNARCNENCIIT